MIATSSKEQLQQMYADAWPRLKAEMRPICDAIVKNYEHGLMPHDCYALKLLELRDWLREYKPSVIVELGSGLTTRLSGWSSTRASGDS